MRLKLSSLFAVRAEKKTESQFFTHVTRTELDIGSDRKGCNISRENFAFFLPSWWRTGLKLKKHLFLTIFTVHLSIIKIIIYVQCFFTSKNKKLIEHIILKKKWFHSQIWTTILRIKSFIEFSYHSKNIEISSFYKL